MIVYSMGAHMSRHQLLQGVLYGVLAALQLVFMFTNRQLYKQHRFKVGMHKA